MRAFVTGGSGFLGKGTTQALAEAGWQARCMVRGHGEKPIFKCAHSEKFVVFESSVGRLTQGIEGCDAVFNLVGIIREFPSKGITFQKAHIDFIRNLIEACKTAGVKRYLHMSALGVDSGLNIGFNTSKLEAENIVRESGLDWTIFRPSLISGPGDRFAAEFAEWIKKGLPIPVIGRGDYRLMPVSRKDLCRGMVKLISNSASINKTYSIGGPDKLGYIEILKTIEKAAGRKMRLMKIPAGLMMLGAELMGRFAWFPVSADMIKQLLKGSVTDEDDFWKEAGIIPEKLEDAVGKYV